MSKLSRSIFFSSLIIASVIFAAASCTHSSSKPQFALSDKTVSQRAPAEDPLNKKENCPTSDNIKFNEKKLAELVMPPGSRWEGLANFTSDPPIEYPTWDGVDVIPGSGMSRPIAMNFLEEPPNVDQIVLAPKKNWDTEELKKTKKYGYTDFRLVFVTDSLICDSSWDTTRQLEGFKTVKGKNNFWKLETVSENCTHGDLALLATHPGYTEIGKDLRTHILVSEMFFKWDEKTQICQMYGTQQRQPPSSGFNSFVSYTMKRVK